MAGQYPLITFSCSALWLQYWRNHCQKGEEIQKTEHKNAFVYERRNSISLSNFDCKIAKNIKNIFKYFVAHATLFGYLFHILVQVQYGGEEWNLQYFGLGLLVVLSARCGLFYYFILIFLDRIAGESSSSEEEERAVVSSASSVSSTETRQVLMTSPRRPTTSTVRKQHIQRIKSMSSFPRERSSQILFVQP